MFDRNQKIIRLRASMKVTSGPVSERMAWVPSSLTIIQDSALRSLTMSV